MIGFPAWSRIAAIGDYDGSLSKEDCTTEATVPYAAQWYSELHAMRGSGFTTAPLTLVDAENLAISRFSAAVWSRTPEKVRANATPLRCDERLDYWVSYLGLATKDGEQRWQLRDRAVAHYRASNGPTQQNISDSLAALLGDAYVNATSATGSDLDNPPPITYWPTINPGSTALSLGGGAWMSERSLLVVETTQPPGMITADFLNLMNVQMFQLLDLLLPCWAAFVWNTSDSGSGFFLDVSHLDFDGL